MTRGRKLLAAVLLGAAAAAFAADRNRSEVPTGLRAREAAEEALQACYLDCRKHSDATAYEDCMVTCNERYPLAPSLNRGRRR